MGSGCKKEYMKMPCSDETVLSAVAKAFFSAIPIKNVVITFQANSGTIGEDSAKKAFFSASIKNFFDEIESDKPTLLFVEGGSTRQESVYKALKALKELDNTDIVLIHDGARPFVSPKIIQSVWKATIDFGSATCGVQPVDTQKEISNGKTILRHLNRANLFAVQTPQGFKFTQLLEAHEKAYNDGQTYTDDTEIWSCYVGSPVHITEGSPDNKKITFPSDLKEQRTEKMEIRTGLGYDLHKLEYNRKLLVGGVEIPHDKGEAGHSDGDVLLHAITDAILGAAALADIGELFPPSDEKWKDADSGQLLQSAWNLVQEDGWNLCNLDCVVKLERPKLLPYRKKIIQSISNILGVPLEKVFVKAKTAEGMECVGNGQAVEAFASCLLFRDN